MAPTRLWANGSRLAYGEAAQAMLEVNHISVLYDRSIIALQGIDVKVE